MDAFIDYRKATRGLTESGEKWLRDLLNTFVNCLTPYVRLENIQRDHLVNFLARYENKPWRRHAFYRAFKTFFKWMSRTYDTPNPMIDKWGNPIIEPPKTPDKILYTITPDNVQLLIRAATSVRNKAIISLLADSGGRRSEIAKIEVKNLNLETCRIKVMGKGNKEGFLLFGATTKALLESYVQQEQPCGILFGLKPEGLKTMLQRLETKTGIKCNPHSFRRAFATELRRQGLSELDIAELGRWSCTTMVKRYSRAYTFDDAAKRYKPIVR